MAKAIITIESSDEPVNWEGAPTQLEVRIEFDPPIDPDPSKALAAHVLAIKMHAAVLEDALYAEQVARDGVEDRKVLKAWEGPKLHGPEV